MLCLIGLARVKNGLLGDDVVAADLTARFCSCPSSVVETVAVSVPPLSASQRHHNL